MSRLRSPIARARGLGSAKDGTGHFWLQRLTAIALVPLLIWFVASVVSLAGAGYAPVAAWMGQTMNAVLFIALMLALCWHSMLGLQVIVEDYIHSGWFRLPVLVTLKFAHVLIAIVAVYAVLRIGTGA
jgi:succinate dehydrogenase / fumarate reductase, membrane anchor subunit